MHVRRMNLAVRAQLCSNTREGSAHAQVRQTKDVSMIWTAWVAVMAVALAGLPAAAQEKTIKIGYVNTFSGPGALIGNDMRNAFELGLDHLGRKLGGLPVEVIYEDDQQKPEVGVQKTQKLLESDHVDFVAGYIWSNVMLGSLKPLVETKTITVITNAG